MFCVCLKEEDGTSYLIVIFLEFQNQTIEFMWSSIMQYDLDDTNSMFCFQYQRQNKAPRWVKIFSNHVSIRYSRITTSHLKRDTFATLVLYTDPLSSIDLYP